MEFTREQISEIISEITNGELGLQGLVKQGLESLMLSERALHNETRGDVSNGFRGRRVCHDGKVFELQTGCNFSHVSIRLHERDCTPKSRTRTFQGHNILNFFSIVNTRNTIPKTSYLQQLVL